MRRTRTDERTLETVNTTHRKLETTRTHLEQIKHRSQKHSTSTNSCEMSEKVKNNEIKRSRAFEKLEKQRARQIT